MAKLALVVPQQGWMKGNGGEDGSYSTAFAALVLAVPDARLSIFRRRAGSEG